MELLFTIKHWFRRNKMVSILVLVLVLDLLSLPLLMKESIAEPIKKISDISDPMIDSEAATDVYVVCTSLPLEAWAFLLLAVGVLLIFNFWYGFTRGEKMQWQWELGFVAAAFLVWCIWDSCQEAAWFPFALLKMSLLIFAVYLHLFEKRQALPDMPEERYTESIL